MNAKNLGRLIDIVESLQRAEDLYLNLPAPMRRGLTVEISDLRRAISGFVEAARTEHVHVHGFLPSDAGVLRKP